MILLEERETRSQESFNKISRSIRTHLEENKQSQGLKNKSCEDDLQIVVEKDLQQKTVKEIKQKLFTNNLKRIKRKVLCIFPFFIVKFSLHYDDDRRCISIDHLLFLQDLETMISELLVKKILYGYQLEEYKDVSIQLLTTLETVKAKVEQLRKEVGKN